MFRIAIHANCQGIVLRQALVQILRNQPLPFAVEMIRNWGPSATSLVAESAQLRRYLSQTDVFLQQVHDAAPDIGAYVPNGALKLRFPVMLMNWLWPFTTQEHPFKPKDAPAFMRICFPQEVCDSSINAFLPKQKIRAHERYLNGVARLRDEAARTAPGRRLPWASHIAAARQALSPEALQDREHRYAAALEAYFRMEVRPKQLDRLFELSREKGQYGDRCSDFAVWPVIEREFRVHNMFVMRPSPAGRSFAPYAR